MIENCYYTSEVIAFLERQFRVKFDEWLKSNGVTEKNASQYVVFSLPTYEGIKYILKKSDDIISVLSLGVSESS